MGVAALGTPGIRVTLEAAALAGQVVLVEMFRVAILEKQLRAETGLAFPPEVAEAQVIREVRQHRVRSGITSRAVPQEMAELAEL
jgi:hypothetical protein